jgi:hypothetical protein
MVNHIQRGEFRDYNSDEEADLFRQGAARRARNDEIKELERLREEETKAARDLSAERRRERDLSAERRRAPYEQAVRSSTKKVP